MPRTNDTQFRNVAVPIEVYEMLRELAYLIKEAHAQIIGGRS